MPLSSTEIKLMKDLTGVILDAVERHRPGQSSVIAESVVSGMERHAAPIGTLLKNLIKGPAGKAVATGVGGLGVLELLGLSQVMGQDPLSLIGGLKGAVLGGTGVGLGALYGLWNLAQNALDPSKRHEVPKPMEGIRRTGPRSDAKWWDRDVPNKAFEVPEYFGVEDVSYEPWYRDRLQKDYPVFRENVGGVPQSFGPMVPGAIFSPYKQESRTGPPPLMSDVPTAKPPSAFDLYDQLTGSPRSTVDPNGNARKVMAQTEKFQSESINIPDQIRNHPYINMIIPNDAESAAAIGAREGWYSPPSRTSPFFDPTGELGHNVPAEWEAKMGQTPLEMHIAKMRAMQQSEGHRMAFGTNWIISNTLAQLSAGMIDKNQAARNIYGWAEMAMMSGVPRQIVMNSLQKGMAAVAGGYAPLLPRRMFQDVTIPDYEMVDWKSLRSPHESRVRGPLLEEIAAKEKALREATPGYGSPLGSVIP